MTKKVVHDYSKVPGFEFMNDPGWIIGNRVYRIRAPSYLMVNEAEVATIGSFHSGDPRRDAQIAKSMTDGWRTILQMFEIWKDKGAIQLVNYTDDIKGIHEVIQRYFEDMATYQRAQRGGTPNLRTTPNGDYVRLMTFAKEFDAFAKEVFVMAIGWESGRGEVEKDLYTMPIPTEQRGDTVKTIRDYSPASDILDFSNLSRRKRY